jgi:hypothetical protein
LLLQGGWVLEKVCLCPHKCTLCIWNSVKKICCLTLYSLD